MISGIRPGRKASLSVEFWYSKHMRSTVFSAGLGLLFVVSTATACGALRQNLRNQFVSYRGAWQCDGGDCKQGGMSRATKQHREGETDITHVTLNNQVAMVWNAGAPPESFSAQLRCGGGSAEVPAERIKAPGEHKIAGQKDSYVILVRAKDYDFIGDCKQVRVKTHATWEAGKKTYEAEAGLKLK